MFNQAIRLSTVENGKPEGWNEYWITGNTVIGGDYSNNIETCFGKYLEPYMKIMHKKKLKDKILYVLPDGSAFAFSKSFIRDVFFYPKNAEKCMARTNRKGICEFSFIFYPMGPEPKWKYHYGKGLEVYLHYWDGSKQGLYSKGLYNCKTSGEYCTAIIKNNGWKIPNDYPRKIQY